MTSSYSCFAILVLVLIQFTYSRQSIQKSYDSESCLFIGCSCGIDKIKCPASRLDLSFTMFPKRSLYKISSKNITLDLSENSIKLLPDDRFAHLNLFKLNLSANQIDTISTYSFRDIGDLKILDLSNNRLSDLRVETLIYFERKLQTIILEGNYLYRMDRIHLGNAISRLEKLENLNLAFNDLRNLPNLTKLINLKILYFASNKIVHLVDVSTQECLLPMSILELHLQYNNIKIVDKNAFFQLTNLKYLNLAFNQISQISETSFIYLTSLEELNLRNNYLKHIPSRIFYTLNHLDLLDLSSQKTRLEEIDDYAFDRRVNYTISSIDLSNNHINKIQPRAFCTTSYGFYAAIKEINLQENNLRHIDSCNMQQLSNGYKEGFKVLIKTSRALRNLTNQHHLLTCDCELTKASKLVNIDGDCLDETKRRISASFFTCTEYWRIKRRETCPKEYNCVIDYKTTTKFTSQRTLLTTTTIMPLKFDIVNATFMEIDSSDNHIFLSQANDTHSVSGIGTRHLEYFLYFLTSLFNILFLMLYC